jgi:hypothetical protein
MIDIIDELNRLSMKFTIKYKIINHEKSQFMKKNDDDEENDNNDSIKKTIQKKTKNVINVIMSKNWTRSTREKYVDKEYEAKKWKKYD